MDSNKRRIPRHVDGRVKIGQMYWKQFAFKFCPICLILLVLFFSSPSPLTLFLCFGAGGGLFLGFSELNNRETGFEILRSIIKYRKQGRIYYERSTKNVQYNFRYTRNKIESRKQTEESSK